MDNEKLLHETYYNPTTGLISANKLYQKLKDQGITLKQIKDFLEKQETSQLFKPVVKNKVFFPIVAYEPNEMIQCDVMDMSNVSTTNSYFKYLLVAIDIFTRVLRVVPMKDKGTDTIIQSMEQIIKHFKCDTVTTDQGKEYTNQKFKNLMKDNDIKHILVDVKQHSSLGVVDRVCRTIRNLINKYCTSHKTTRYIDALSKLIDNYNNTYHSTIKCTPNDAINHIDEINNIMMHKYKVAQENETVFNVNDKVRHLINLSIFEKQGQAKWSHDVLTVVDKLKHSYQLSNGKWFRYWRLQNVQQTEALKKAGRPTKHTMQSIKKTNTVNRKLRKEDVNVKNIVKEKRTRQKTDRFTY